MLTDWIHWLSQKHPEQILAVLCALVLVDSPRYALSMVAMVIYDMSRDSWRWLRGLPPPESFRHCPSVSVVIAGYNEGDTIEATLNSIWRSYPRLEIIVVNDGSTDNMLQVAQRHARAHAGITVLSRQRRGGKSSAMNFGRLYATGEIIVFVDADSQLGPRALWHVVQPFMNPKVGVVSATVLARNAFVSPACWFQAYEYLQTIFVGRQMMARLGLLSIASGAFGAFRRECLDRSKGPDVELAEDLDQTIRARKAGYDVAFVPEAQCFTNVPSTWRGLCKQRLRWEESSIVRLFCRKHVDLAYFWKPSFRWSNFLVLLEFWTLNVLFVIGIWAYFAWFTVAVPVAAWDKMILTLYVGYIGFEMPRVLALLYYTRNWGRDMLLCCCFPLVPFYQFLLFLVRSRALLEEVFLRKSYSMEFFPSHVREATWRW